VVVHPPQGVVEGQFVELHHADVAEVRLVEDTEQPGQGAPAVGINVAFEFGQGDGQRGDRGR
jgi:hypothetical protein